MNVKQALQAIRALGLKAKFDSEWSEFRIAPKGMTAEREEACAYYTPDAEDAVGTARMMWSKHNS